MVRMVTFSKAQLVSLLASCVDFGVTWILVKQLQTPQIPGSTTGTVCGGITHFLISRNWTFSAQEKKWTVQLTRYILVWIGNLILNSAGLWLLTRAAGWDIWIAKIVISIVIAVCYNYVLQKRYVFK